MVAPSAFNTSALTGSAMAAHPVVTKPAVVDPALANPAGHTAGVIMPPVDARHIALPLESQAIGADIFQRFSQPDPANALAQDAFSASAAHPSAARVSAFTTNFATKLSTTVGHPNVMAQLINSLSKQPLNTLEPLAQQQAMARALWLALPAESKPVFSRLLAKGVLNQTSEENGHTTLYHLHQRLTQPVLKGFTVTGVLTTMIDLLDRPYIISQKPAPLQHGFVEAMLDIEKNPVQGNQLHKTVYVQRPHTRQTLNIASSFDCTASAVMFGMLEQQPSEIIRQLNGLTSPVRTFTKTVRLSDLNAQSPEKALAQLKQQHVPFIDNGNGSLTVQVTAPEQVVLRALSDSTIKNRSPRQRDGLQTLYEMTLVELADPNGYDEADGRMVAEDGSDPGGGLPGDLIDMMSSLIEGRGGTGSVTVQVMDSKAGDSSQRPYLYGYTLPFDYTQKLLVDALSKNVMPMVGIVYLDETGGYEGGHYIRLAGTYVDPETKERYFVVADSDDGRPTTVTIAARKLIPMINRLHLSAKDATNATALIDQLGSDEQIFTTDDEDKRHYDVLPLATHAEDNQPTPTQPQTKTQPVKTEQSTGQSNTQKRVAA
jgi:hypothetical protein